MNCYLHTETQATAFCRECGRALCNACQKVTNGTIYCQEHMPMNASSATAANAANPYLQNHVTPSNASPAGAFWLGLIPGVGAIYNGQYVKGLVHALIFGLLVSMTNASAGTTGEPMLGMMAFAFYAYMPFEAFHTAKKRQQGLPVEEWSSLIAPNRYMSRAPIGPILLILIGVVFLLDTLNLIQFRELTRFWPVVLIIAGVVMLYNRLTVARREVSEHSRMDNNSVESLHER